jgi:hypothetical protein
MNLQWPFTKREQHKFLDRYRKKSREDRKAATREVGRKGMPI